VKEISLYILDIAQNSLAAGAALVTLDIARSGRFLTVDISDDGRGMDAEFLKAAADPFTTTRTTRRVGMGIPLFKLVTQQSGGEFSIQSAPGEGTKISGSFDLTNIDTPPPGDITGTLITLIQGAPDTVDFIINLRLGEKSDTLDTRVIRETLGGDVRLSEPDVLGWIEEYLKEKFVGTEMTV
jgi:signal transduction histidine kinase